MGETGSKIEINKTLLLSLSLTLSLTMVYADDTIILEAMKVL
jgi:hypothetical protein